MPPRKTAAGQTERWRGHSPNRRPAVIHRWIGELNALSDEPTLFSLLMFFKPCFQGQALFSSSCRWKIVHFKSFFGESEWDFFFLTGHT